MTNFLTRTIFIFLILLSTEQIFAQNNAIKHFTICGNVKNATSKFWEFGLTGFFNEDNRISLPIDAKGNFSKTIDLKNPQDLFLLLNDDLIPIFTTPGDTLTFNWDERNFRKTFKINAGTSMPWRQKELDLMLELYYNYRKTAVDLMREIPDQKIAVSVKAEKIKKLYLDYTNTIKLYGASPNAEKISTDAYYFFLKSFTEKLNETARSSNVGHYNQYNLNSPDSLAQYYAHSAPRQKLLDEHLFLISPVYRDYIQDKTRFNSAFNSIFNIKEAEILNSNITLNDCYEGMASLSNSRLIREWYLVNSIISGYGWYGYEQSEIAYQKFRPEITIPEYASVLENFHSSIQQLKPGNMAPDFKLKDQEGKIVSLIDFKGKIIYIDFWGVFCGPCLADIKENAAKVHEKYKDVVFLNICVDANEKQWKTSIQELNFDGIHVLADGWVKNPVCKAYNISGIPHYVLIDAQGKLVNNSAPPLYWLLQGNNELDKLISSQNQKSR